MIEFDYTDEYKRRFVQNAAWFMTAQDIVDWCDDVE